MLADKQIYHLYICLQRGQQGRFYQLNPENQDDNQQVYSLVFGRDLVGL